MNSAASSDASSGNARARRTTTTTRGAPRRPLKRRSMIITPIMVVWICLFLIICIWIMGAIYISTTTTNATPNIPGGKMHSPPLLLPGLNKPLSGKDIMNTDKNKHQHLRQGHHVNKKNDRVDLKIESNQIIDMRNLTATLPFDDPDGGAWKQGWDVKPKEGPLTVFVVPHSHCDPGWIKTFDEYFQSQTKSILTTVIDALNKDPRRKFVWAEISYFEWWWREQSPSTQETTRRLLKNKQFEFVTGGWVQPDEANTQIRAMEIQLQEGHDFINKTFGSEYIPKYGWSIDPFGYSPTMAYLLHKYNFQAMLIQRVHYAVKKELAQRQHLEFMWRQTWDTKGDHDIFTHVMPFFSYDVPHTCGPDPAICCQFDFARLISFGGCPWRKPPVAITPSNVEERSLLLLDQYRKKAALYRSNVVIAPLGDDFRYLSPDEAEAQYTNYQKVMDYVNDHVPDVTIQFGSLSDYFEKVLGTFDVPVLKGSFFTYADRQQDYWSGYFTSRVFDKALDRKLERVLFAAESLGASKQELQEPRRALSLFQHHDGVTGTAKDHVVRDYAARIHAAIRQAQDIIRSRLKLGEKTEACWQSDSPRGMSQNLCEGEVQAYNPLDTSQFCGATEVHGRSTETVRLPCEIPGPHSATVVRFDAHTGLMTHPVKEEWMVWKVRKGGAYLFVPGHLQPFEDVNSTKVELGGYVVSTRNWKRTVIVHEVTDEYGEGRRNVVDFIYETNLQTSNEEWFVRFSSNIQNDGIFHTDLNGFNFDTHYFRKDLPIQSQVFPMPTLASIEDANMRMTILSEHAQGTASLADGSIDVWLDRRLAQDDERGLFQGVTDNVPTRTRLRLLLEQDGYSSKGEFDITPLCRRMWDELNHPLELFGALTFKSAQEAKAYKDNSSPHLDAKVDQQARRIAFDVLTDPEKVKERLSESLRTKVRSSAESYFARHPGAPIVPFCIMVHKRIDLLMVVIDSLRASDFDRKNIPLFISHDGHVAEMVSYVEELKSEFNIVQLFHPYSCYEHPSSFPGNDETLNKGYAGDRYGNKRNGMVTCCKHHFTWMLKTVFEMEWDQKRFDTVAFFEEDYVLAPTIYESVVSGLKLYEELTHKGKDETMKPFFGIVLEGRIFKDFTKMENGWDAREFGSGPVVLKRDMYELLRANANAFCTVDDYNWDWSIVHMMNEGLLPSHVLYPTTPQVMHIGIDGGLHGGKFARWQLFSTLNSKFPAEFHGTKFVGDVDTKQEESVKREPFGGWGHRADHDHCLRLLS